MSRLLLLLLRLWKSVLKLDSIRADRSLFCGLCVFDSGAVKSSFKPAFSSLRFHLTLPAAFYSGERSILFEISNRGILRF